MSRTRCRTRGGGANGHDGHPLIRGVRCPGTLSARRGEVESLGSRVLPDHCPPHSGILNPPGEFSEGFAVMPGAPRGLTATLRAEGRRKGSGHSIVAGVARERLSEPARSPASFEHVTLSRQRVFPAFTDRCGDARLRPVRRADQSAPRDAWPAAPFLYAGGLAQSKGVARRVVSPACDSARDRNDGEDADSPLRRRTRIIGEDRPTIIQVAGVNDNKPIDQPSARTARPDYASSQRRL